MMEFLEDFLGRKGAILFVVLYALALAAAAQNIYCVVPDLLNFIKKVSNRPTCFAGP
jgi:hypothetical protein